MIANVAVLKAKPGMEEELSELLKSFVAMIGDEDGTLTYSLHRAKKDPAQFMFYEVYKDKAALEYHGSTPHFQEIMGKKVAPFLAEKPKMDWYELIASKE